MERTMRSYRDELTDGMPSGAASHMFCETTFWDFAHEPPDAVWTVGGTAGAALTTIPLQQPAFTFMNTDRVNPQNVWAQPRAAGNGHIRGQMHHQGKLVYMQRMRYVYGSGPYLTNESNGLDHMGFFLGAAGHVDDLVNADPAGRFCGFYKKLAADDPTNAVYFVCGTQATSGTIEDSIMHDTGWRMMPIPESFVQSNRHYTDTTRVGGRKRRKARLIGMVDWIETSWSLEPAYRDANEIQEEGFFVKAYINGDKVFDKLVKHNTNYPTGSGMSPYVQTWRDDNAPYNCLFPGPRYMRHEGEN